MTWLLVIAAILACAIWIGYAVARALPPDGARQRRRRR